MILQLQKLPVRCAWLFAVAAVLLYGGTAAAKDLSVCLDTSSTMFAINNQLAQAVASREGATLQVHKYNSKENDTVNGMAGFTKLTAKCALVLGFPLDTDATKGELGSLHATTPYAHTGFVLVTPAASKAATLDQLPSGSHVALVYMTPPTLYLMAKPRLRAMVEMQNAGAFKALAAGKANAALLWHPAVVKYQAEHANANLAMHAVHQPHASFNLVALYDGKHAQAAAAFEQAVASIRASGELQKILGGYAEIGPASTSGAKTASDPPSASGGAQASVPASSAGAHASGKPALYTAAQAKAGQHQFLDNCAMCHGPTLEGDVGPALKGKHFAPAKADYHVSDIFTIVSHNMPATQPGTLPHKTYVQVMAFLLQQNGYPAGSKALTFEGAMHSKAKFISSGNQ